MKKLLIVFLALVMLFSSACGAEKAPAATPAPTPEATVEPTPEPTPPRINMDCAIADVLDADQQSFLSSIRSNPPAVASIYIDGEFPETIILDLDTVRSICSAVSGLRVSAEVLGADSDKMNHITLTRSNSESFTINFAGDKLMSLDSYYEIEDSEALWASLRQACEKVKADAEANKATISSDDFKTIVYNKDDQWKMNFSHSKVEPVGANDGAFQTIRTTIGITNTGIHLIMSVKLIAKYMNEDGYVVAENPVDLDFNAVPIYLGEYREYLLDQVVYNPNGADSDLPAATEVIFTIVNVNAPNEAGH